MSIALFANISAISWLVEGVALLVTPPKSLSFFLKEDNEVLLKLCGCLCFYPALLFATEDRKTSIVRLAQINAVVTAGMLFVDFQAGNKVFTKLTVGFGFTALVLSSLVGFIL